MTDDGPILVDYDVAALYADVTPAAVRQWVSRGRLPRRGRDGRRVLVDLRDVDRIAPRPDAPPTDAA